jgi:hypothetical protein
VAPYGLLALVISLPEQGEQNIFVTEDEGLVNQLGEKGRKDYHARGEG